MAGIRVKAAGGVTKFMPGQSSNYEAEIPEGTTVGEMLDALGVPRDGPSIILVNRTTAGLDTKLNDGDEVHLLPMVVGG
jgi:molybdopterin converting factor small subunit